MNKKYSYLSKNVLLFTISTLGPKLISFLMVRIYTSSLTTSEYGIAELITTTVTLAVPLLTVCIDSGILRFSLDSDTDNREVYSNSQFILLRGVLLSAIGTFIVALVFRNSININYFLFFFLFFCANSTYNFFSCFSRGIDKVNVMVEMSLITTFLSCLLNILFLPILDWGLNGYMIANISGLFMSTVWGFGRIKAADYFERKLIKKEAVKEIEQYSFPLVFNQIGWWLNNSVDKYIVTAFLGANMNGIYGVSYKIPTILSTLSGIFANAWALSAIKEFDQEDKDGFVSKMYNLYNAVLIVSCSILIILNIPIASFLYANDFFVAWHYTGPLMIAVIFGGLSGFLGAIFSAVKDTKVYSISTVLGGFVNIGVSLLLVNLLGIMGVAIGTLVANIFIWMMRLTKSRKYIKFKMTLKKDCLAYSLLIAQFIVGLKGFNMGSTVIQIGLLIVIVILYYESITNFLQKLGTVIVTRIRK